MPLIEINQSRHVSASIRLDATTAMMIDQYAAFIHASADDVVDKALNYVFSKDRDFQEFLKTEESAQIVPTLRIRRSPGNEASEPLPSRKKPIAAMETPDALRRESASKA